MSMPPTAFNPKTMDGPVVPETVRIYSNVLSLIYLPALSITY
jgi:hypothetical protein